MRVGDTVRFARTFEAVRFRNWQDAEKKHIGLLLEHDKIQGNVTILFKGELVKLRACLAEKAGKKDQIKIDNRAKNC